MSNRCTRCQVLEERIAELEEAMGLNVESPMRIHLTRNERRMFGLMLRRPSGVTMQSFVTVRRNKREGRLIDPVASAEVQLSYLRKKLRAEGVEIERVVGEHRDAYRIRPTTMVNARALMEDHHATQ